MKYPKLQFSIKSVLSLFLKTSYLGVIGLFLLDFYFYQGFVQNNLASPIVIGLVVLVAHAVIHAKMGLRISDSFVRFNWYILAPVTVLIGLAAYYLEEYGLLFPNYFFTNFRFHYIAMPYIALPAFGFGAVHASKKFWQENWKNVVLILSTGMVIAAGFLFYHDALLYKSLTVEDGVVEYLTALGFLIGGIFALLLTNKRNFFTNSLVRNTFIAGCILVGLSLFFVAGEEISWGQRILGIETPEAIAEQNRQGEINLHNSEAFWPYVYSAYFYVGLYGIGVWIVEWLTRDILVLTKKQEVWKKILIPGAHLFVLFGMISLYVWLRTIHGPWKYQPWEEYAELLLVIGITIHLCEVYFTFPKRA
jgi:hypothetical protein